MRNLVLSLCLTAGALASGCSGGNAPPGGDAGRDSGYLEMCSGGPLAAPIVPCAPRPPPSTGDPAQDCVDRINQFRWECQCLPPLARWSDGEMCAAANAEYDFMTGVPHSGFRDRICESGFGQNECPGWRSIEHTIDQCLQAMWDEGPGADFQMHGHYLNMSSTRFTRVACGWYETPRGDVWAVQNFR
jgi:hypothetical protein